MWLFYEKSRRECGHFIAPRFVITSVRDTVEPSATIGPPTSLHQPIAARRSGPTLPRLDCSVAQLTEPPPAVAAAAVPLLTPLSESSGGARSLTDLHKDLDTIFTGNTPPKFKSTHTSTPGIGSKTRKTEQLTPQLNASSSAAAGLLSPCMPAMSRIKSLSRMSLLDVPSSGGSRNSGGGGGDPLLDMYHTVSGDLMSASRPAIPFARITTTNRPRQQQEVPEATKAAPPARKAERWDGGDTEWDCLQGLSEEVWRVSAPVCVGGAVLSPCGARHSTLSLLYAPNPHPSLSVACPLLGCTYTYYTLVLFYRS